MNTSQTLTERPTDAAQPAAAAAEGARRPAITPAVDIVEDAQRVTLRADLPGVPRENLDVKVHDNTLTIDAQARIDTPADLRVRHAEVRVPRFMRSFVLSADLDTTRIDANLRDGVLTLTIPRREEARPRRIDVTVGGA
ncbi:Hsp20/alpha crystallin family protein [Burkholderia vietnamiensis]|uniref:Hsp20/alpha crystallin family protein n=1 Tax=Burkholderia vietnamiensis TaxID=60552 RepID=UPI001593BBCD|nr:Hsp20/alpha crystallin family protein [Burkholderia vietnamiensis]MBR8187893.1 Hsp20/alpha crystallin family protein [Burkholderia vietnamiensis]MCA8229312.1 Hsp20/alpha crystallin family protein [Burkholderia vietnamiensis]MCO1349836.1 Hsp20/alpha crystallin family protein [Burkholderia vietnamiensis]MCO1432306.1 Hsp20/alpha crystallin family protein [Burkholderia vietnamiensis]MDN8035287.1 Hsp20/alpha crystallin family protein [Burkholderia vietnamiensis]